MTNLMTRRLRAACGCAAAVVATASVTATAAPCSDLPNPIYLTGSTAFEPTAAQFAVRASGAPNNTTLVYAPQGSCLAPPAIRDGTALGGTGDIYTLPDPAMPPVKGTCDIPSGTLADIGVADVSYSSCFNEVMPTTISDSPGPVQAMEFIVPKASQITSLSAEQARNIWGCGATGGLSPLTDDQGIGIQQRDQNSGTQIMVSKYIGVAPNLFKGKTNGSGGALVTSLLAVASPQEAIGFLAADAYDSAVNRGQLNALAFRGVGQTKAYYADSAPSKFDKVNVRDGHYTVFGPVHLFAKLDTNGMVSANAQKVIGWIQGIVPIDTANPRAHLDIEARAGMIPRCAMKVQRDDDGGLLRPYKPAESCGCYFEHVRIGTDSLACGNGGTAGNGGVCAYDSACKNGTTCQTGYCE